MRRQCHTHSTSAHKLWHWRCSGHRYRLMYLDRNVCRPTINILIQGCRCVILPENLPHKIKSWYKKVLRSPDKDQYCKELWVCLVTWNWSVSTAQVSNPVEFTIQWSIFTCFLLDWGSIRKPRQNHSPFIMARFSCLGEQGHRDVREFRGLGGSTKKVRLCLKLFNPPM